LVNAAASITGRSCRDIDGRSGSDLRVDAAVIAGRDVGKLGEVPDLLEGLVLVGKLQELKVRPGHEHSKMNGWPHCAPSVPSKEGPKPFPLVNRYHASCEDFRAAADIDLEMDKADEAAGRKIECPLHVLWGAKNTVGSLWDVPATWREKSAASVTGKALDCGHFLQEERPQDLLAELREFLS
jgi:pimeloyl-ACP methyl ester carboxylesterase